MSVLDVANRGWKGMVIRTHESCMAEEEVRSNVI